MPTKPNKGKNYNPGTGLSIRMIGVFKYNGLDPAKPITRILHDINKEAQSC